MKRFSTLLFSILTVIGLLSFDNFKKQKPALYLVGDSTVRNGDDTGKDNLWGWGSFIHSYFDTTRISIYNDAMGGRSSRTFITEGRWDKVVSRLKPGDYVILQFGHNDRGPLDDTARARGTIKGTGTESKEIYNPIRKQQEIVYTYGWYLRKYIADTKAKGAIPVICSLEPRNIWTEGKIERCNTDYAKWAKDVADETGCFFIDLNALVADKYQAMDSVNVKFYFPKDHTHTNEAGAKLTAEILTNAIMQMKKCKLKTFLK